MKLVFSIFIMLSSFSFEVLAGEVYKWKDKDGKLHYSEKKPTTEVDVRSVDLNNGKQFSEIENPPAIKATNKNNRHIVIVRPDSFWDVKNSQQMTTTYFFGGDCVSGTDVSFQDMKENHPSILPRINQLVDYVIKPIRQLDYSVSSSNKAPLFRNLARFEEPLVLRFEYNELQLHLCMFNLKQRTRASDKKRVRSEPFDFGVSDFSRRRATISLNWRLEDPKTGDIIYQSTTSGSANYWLKDVHKYGLKVFKKAFENSTSNLFSKPEFIQYLQPNKKDSSALPSKIAIPKLEDQSLFDNMQGLLSSNVQKKSKFASVLGSIAPLKSMTVEYYLTHNAWPTRLSDIGVTSGGIFDDQYVTDVQFDFDGAIVLSLNESEFEKNAMLSLQPEVRMGGAAIDWQCLTNLDDSYYNNICSTVE